MKAYFGLARTRINDPQTDFCMNTIIPLVYPPVIEFPLHTGEISAGARGEKYQYSGPGTPLLDFPAQLARAQQTSRQIFAPSLSP
jgi:hypothetical protein